MNSTSRCAAILALMFAKTASAGWEHQNTFVVEPDPAHEGQLLYMRIDNEVGCFSGGPQAFATQQGNQLTVKFYPVDHACPVGFRTPLRARLGSFEAGTYTMLIQLCPVPPLPCDVVETQTLVIQPARSPQRIPVLSLVGLCVTTLCMLAFGLLRR